MMTLSQVENEIQRLGADDFPYQIIQENILTLKKSAVATNDQSLAKQLWCYETIVSIHELFNTIFNLLKNKEYYIAWCKLETVEIELDSLRKHFSDFGKFGLTHVDKTVRNLQALFPYRIFASTEIIEKKKKCNICDKNITIRNPCGHKVGEIYNGEYCIRIVTDFDFVGVALVENPVHKYAVMFTVDPITNEKIDSHNYNTIEYLLELIKSPYEEWDLELQNKRIPHAQFKAYGRNDSCPCQSGIKYKKCCLPTPGVLMLNHEFIVKEPTAKKIFARSVK